MSKPSSQPPEPPFGTTLQGGPTGAHERKWGGAVTDKKGEWALEARERNLLTTVPGGGCRCPCFINGESEAYRDCH